MEELKEFFKDVKRIADGVDYLVKNTIETNKQVSELCKTATEKIEKLEKDAVCENASMITSAFDIPQAPVEQPIPQLAQVPVQTAIPVSNAVQTYTQDQLAVAMGRAIDAGKMAEIQKLLTGFGVSSLMELKPEQYNDLALRLKEIGVDV